MKKIISISLVCMLLLGCVLSLASCGKILFGKYSLGNDTFGTSYDFSLNKVTITYNVLGFSKSSEGTYKIGENEDGDAIITFTFEDEDAEKYTGDFSFSQGEEDGVKYIKIGGVKYTKSE